MALEWVQVFASKEEADSRFKVNSTKKVVIDPYVICLGRTPEGYYAIDDHCPHDRASLSEGECTANGAVVCPWHHFVFDLKTGKFLGKDLNIEATTYPVRVDDNGLFIGIPVLS